MLLIPRLTLFQPFPFSEYGVTERREWWEGFFLPFTIYNCNVFLLFIFFASPFPALSECLRGKMTKEHQCCLVRSCRGVALVLWPSQFCVLLAQWSCTQPSSVYGKKNPFWIPALLRMFKSCSCSSPVNSCLVPGSTLCLTAYFIFLK